ncbi:hypothetical protein [Priestia flexa]|uniref:hypothetical protein n=1 Tax=Priestia flexa TaxID=86664 RepID=UPI0013D28B0F|nr:hypothetical protein [Priestia flexa]
MSEQQQYEGDRWTKQSISILEQLNWNQLGSANFDIPCFKKPKHGTGKSQERKNDHGIDSIFSYFDPFLKENVGVIVESKKRVWSGVNTSTIQGFVEQLLMTIECAALSEDIQSLGGENVNTGLLMIWCSSLNDYNSAKIDEYLSNIKLTNRKTPITIYIATNREILRWCSLIEYLNSIKESSKVSSFEFFYPSDYFGNGQTMGISKPHLSLIQMFSNYIFARSKEEVRDKDGVRYRDVNHVFFYTNPTKQELTFMYQLVQKFQLESGHELRIHFHGEQSKYRSHIEAFLRGKKEEFRKNDSYLEITFNYLTELKDVPEKYKFREEV